MNSAVIGPRFGFGLCLAILASFLPLDLSAAPARADATGPLRVHQQNPRYFADAGGRAVLLVGSHTWNNLQDMGPEDPPAKFDFRAYLDFLDRYHHNFIRLWRWELVTWDTQANREQKPQRHVCAPHPWARTGPEMALDGKPKFDLTKFDDAYFTRLRERVRAARDRGVYVSVMLFEGWGMQFVQDAWKAHPFHPANNRNGLDGDANADGKGLEVHTLTVPQATATQEAYVRKVIDTVNDLDNVLYEISNENHPSSTEWHYHFIRFIHQYERTKPKQHPVGMTFQYQGGSNTALFNSPAEWVSPNPDAEGDYSWRDNPPPATGSKVVINDTDHLWGIGGDAVWVWKSLTRGSNPIFMDPYDNRVLGKDPEPRWLGIRKALGQARRLAERVDLARLCPAPELASTRFCLADAGRDYVIFVPGGGEVKVELGQVKGPFRTEWIHPIEGTVTPGPETPGGGQRALKPPFAGDAVLHLTAGKHR